MTATNHAARHVTTRHSNKAKHTTRAFTLVEPSINAPKADRLEAPSHRFGHTVGAVVPSTNRPRDCRIRLAAVATTTPAVWSKNTGVARSNAEQDVEET
jgi:hypothetical protein